MEGFLAVRIAGEGADQLDAKACAHQRGSIPESRPKGATGGGANTDTTRERSVVKEPSQQ
jgi:hypothetical protein